MKIKILLGLSLLSFNLLFAQSLTQSNAISTESIQKSKNDSTIDVVQLYDDVLLCNSIDSLILSYQWYKDSIVIEGANKQYYYQEGGLNGFYSVRLITIDGTIIHTTPKEFISTTRQGVKLFPNPMRRNEQSFVTVFGFNADELKGASLSIYSTQGICIYRSTVVDDLNVLNLNLDKQAYIGKLTLLNGLNYEFKILVQD